MDWRYFHPDTDLDAAIRIWHEIGWINRNDPNARTGMAAYTLASRGYVAEVHGLPECFVFRTPGTLRYLKANVPLSAVTGVATSRNGRKQGLAMGLTARAVAEAAAEGAAVAVLSTFEQGFYDRIGFGNGAYEHTWRFDPARLTVSDKVRPPHHLLVEHIEAMHDARLQRHRAHGAVTLESERMTRSVVLRSANGFGLGYYDEDVETPTHFLWCSTLQTARGPYAVEFMAWRTPAQFLELLGLIKQWGDQVRLVVMPEPSGIQLQDLMDRPTQHYWSTTGGENASLNRAHANYQYRILDLKACIEATQLPGAGVAFNLELSDPISQGAADSVDWPGLSGTYRVELGGTSHVVSGADQSLPTLRASVGAFTRLWLGVRPATGLAVTDALAGPPALLSALDEALRLPAPLVDWPL